MAKKARITWEAKNSSFYEMDNRQWIHKSMVNSKWWWVGFSVEYTLKYDEQRKRNIIDEVLSITKEKTPIEKLYDWQQYYENDSPSPILFSKIAEKIVSIFKDKKVTSTKLRQYYDIINWLYSSFLNGNDLKTKLYMTLAKANYDKGRKTVADVFVEFLTINIDKIFDESEWKTEKDRFLIFKKHFEAVVAYGKLELNN